MQNIVLKQVHKFTVSCGCPLTGCVRRPAGVRKKTKPSRLSVFLIVILSFPTTTKRLNRVLRDLSASALSELTKELFLASPATSRFRTKALSLSGTVACVKTLCIVPLYAPRLVGCCRQCQRRPSTLLPPHKSEAFQFLVNHFAVWPTILSERAVKKRMLRYICSA
jgi:BarA-like signal transduction histidine kinase